jgi:serralysin
VLAGYTLGHANTRDFLLARYGADGGLDNTFGDHGKVTTDVGGGNDYAENLAVDSTGRIVLVGRATSPTILDIALVRYHSNGALDSSFDGDGILTADFHGRGEFGQDLAFDPNGKVVATGRREQLVGAGLGP